MKKRWKLFATSLVALQMLTPLYSVSALSLDGSGAAANSASGSGYGEGGGDTTVFYGVAGLRWTPASGGTRLVANLWSNVNTSSSDITLGGITYKKYGYGSYYDVPYGYTGYYMEGYQFSNPSNSLWNDYNLVRSQFTYSDWLYKKEKGGWSDAWGAGALPDPQAHRQALEDGYYLNSWDVYQKGDQ